MFLKEENVILANPDILSESHLPPEIHARESELKEIGICLRPITEGKKPMTKGDRQIIIDFQMRAISIQQKPEISTH